MSRAVAHQKLGDIYRQVGRSAEASRQLEQAVRLAEQLALADPDDLAVKDCLSRSHVGLGEIHLEANRTELALGHFRQVVDLCEQVIAADAGHPGARRGLLEAYIRLGRAHGFHRDFHEAGAWFQKARALAEQWLLVEPGHAEASAMLAWSYRKIGDIGKLSGNFEAARDSYLEAISVGRRSLQAHPSDRETKTHLATALNDLAGVFHRRRELAVAGPLYGEAERLFADLVQADPENADTRFFLIHAQYDCTRLLRDLGRFPEAAAAYRRAIDSLSRFPAERVSARPQVEFLQVALLRRDLADCDAAPLALGALARLRTKPAREACPLLLSRARLLVARNRPADALDAVEALSALEVHSPEDAATLRPALDECTRILKDPRFAGPSEPRRTALLRRCNERTATLEAAQAGEPSPAPAPDAIQP